MATRTRLLVAALLLVLPAALVAQESGSTGLLRDLERLAKGEGMPKAALVTPDAYVVRADTTIKGSVVSQGRLDVRGRIEGFAVSLSNDVVVHRGGVVTGDALSVGGHVTADSGVVLGEIRTMSSLPAILGGAAAVAAPLTASQRTMEATRIVCGTFAILLIVALGVVLFAGPNLDETVATIQRQFARAFWYGVLGQLVVLPALLAIIIALTLTVIGILLIPFAIVAYAIACAGIVTLGFLAVSRLVGSAAWRSASTGKVRAMGTLMVGVSIFFALWLIAALLTWAPLAATVVRAAALAVTWSAMTLGLGAAILSRAGTHRRVASAARTVELASWQTPTPITGVVAARRPVAAAREAR
jgi:cytoskeletal protein CcmA (bactofilin family)